MELPSLHWEDEDVSTRPLPLDELPLQARIDSERENRVGFKPEVLSALINLAALHQLK